MAPEEYAGHLLVACEDGREQGPQHPPADQAVVDHHQRTERTATLGDIALGEPDRLGQPERVDLSVGLCASHPGTHAKPGTEASVAKLVITEGSPASHTYPDGHAGDAPTMQNCEQ